MARRVLIVGAGEAGRMLLREMRTRAGQAYEVAGFLDDDPALRGADVEGAPVLGGCDNIASAVARYGVGEVIVAVPTAGRAFVRRVVAQCRDARVPFRIVPGMLEIIKGPVRLEQLRDVRPDDLLGRESAEFDEEAIGAGLAGRRVLVTGAGGSIGGEICRQISRFDLDRLALLGRGENQIYEIEHELRALAPALRVETIIVDVRDARALERSFVGASPHFVYHAAAHKHVHYMEAFPEEAVKNNIVGTRNVIAAARAAGADRVVMLSTDKAVDPGGVMGATKRVAEYLMAGASGESGPRFISVRFGNVLASRGSVVPLFVSQIQAGGPVTVSHEHASRFFMSLKEACMLVVQASMMGGGGEVFILRMGEPIRIAELARDLIALHGLRPEIDVGVEITGLRPGEKLHEALVAAGEEAVPSAHPHILVARPRPPAGFDAGAVVAELEELAEAGDRAGIRRCLGRVIPDAALGAGASEPVEGGPS
ncbi:MAG: polysaccharide biosynthesis protein [Candidatus Krumholzibacteria bacterium]|nr:polysaccharide biosynthesis protein [Candidatus Krumholzibacteria bacterium]